MSLSFSIYSNIWEWRYMYARPYFVLNKINRDWGAVWFRLAPAMPIEDLPKNWHRICQPTPCQKVGWKLNCGCYGGVGVPINWPPSKWAPGLGQRPIFWPGVPWQWSKQPLNLSAHNACLVTTCVRITYIWQHTIYYHGFSQRITKIRS